MKCSGPFFRETDPQALSLRIGGTSNFTYLPSPL